MEKQDRLLSSTLLQGHKQVEVVLNRRVFAWREADEGGKTSSGISSLLDPDRCHTIQVCDIVAVFKAKDGDRVSRNNWNSGSQLHPHAFTVSYVRRSRQHRWRCDDVTFHCANHGLCSQWTRLLNEQLAQLGHRPRNLLVYINPYGGKRRAKCIYEQKVAPLFRRASVATDVIVTESANHARDHLISEAKLNKYDGVVCVGGDGMFSEIVHGLVTRTQVDSGVDHNQPDAELVQCGLRIGIIPAGSTDCICFATVGTNDAVTSALHIIVGDSQPMDVCSVHHNNTFLRFSVSLLGYGFYGDLLAESETKRWLGPARYDLAGVKTFLSHHLYEGTVSFLPADSEGSPRDKVQCRAGCSVCWSQPRDIKPWEVAEGKEKDSSHREAQEDGWRVIHGKFLAINAACMSCACPRSPKGLSPSAHLADGNTDLILVRKCSRFDFLRHLMRHTNTDDQFDHSFVEVHRVRKFRFRPQHGEPDSSEDLSETPKKAAFPALCSPQASCNDGALQSSWTCDGEVLRHAAIAVSVQCQLIRLFARGIEDEEVEEEEEEEEEEEQQRRRGGAFQDSCALWAPEQSLH